MKKYILTVHIPSDEIYDKISLEYLRYESYEKIFWKSLVAPHKIDLIFKYLNDTGVNNVKDFFKEAYKESKYKNYCSFNVVEQE